MSETLWDLQQTQKTLLSHVTLLNERLLNLNSRVSCCEAANTTSGLVGNHSPAGAPSAIVSPPEETLTSDEGSRVATPKVNPQQYLVPTVLWTPGTATGLIGGLANVVPSAAAASPRRLQQPIKKQNKFSPGTSNESDDVSVFSDASCSSLRSSGGIQIFPRQLSQPR